jgi:hypothetical protein
MDSMVHIASQGAPRCALASACSQTADPQLNVQIGGRVRSLARRRNPVQADVPIVDSSQQERFTRAAAGS